MYIGSKRAHLSQNEGLSRVSQRVSPGGCPFSFLGAMLFAPFLLMGCANHAVSSGLAWQQQQAVPDSKVADYRIAPCETLWPLDGKEVLENSLYWLRAMDCADRIGNAQARALAKTLPGSNWHNIFKQSILLSNANPSLAERRQIVENLNRYRLDFPHALRPLLQLCYQQQVLHINLFDERARYQHLQESSDSQIELLHQNQIRLQSQLQETSRKLENLTDIERQLSSRKQLQGEIPESVNQPPKSEATNKPAASGKAAEPEQTGTALPVEPEDSETPPDHKESPTQ